VPGALTLSQQWSYAHDSEFDPIFQGMILLVRDQKVLVKNRYVILTPDIQ
jgi:hypothetical protein